MGLDLGEQLAHAREVRAKRPLQKAYRLSCDRRFPFPGALTKRVIKIVRHVSHMQRVHRIPLAWPLAHLQASVARPEGKGDSPLEAVGFVARLRLPEPARGYIPTNISLWAVNNRNERTGLGGVLCGLAMVVAVLIAPGARADEVRVAVAANFLEPLKSLYAAFQQASGHSLGITPGSTGQLYAQIANGAPFDVFLSADDEHPKRLVKEGVAIGDSRFTYAVGRVVLWSSEAGVVGEDAKTTLREGKFRHLAIANPETAPYGRAAKQALEKLQLWRSVEAKIVRGENIAQTLQMISTGNAELGFVALSQVARRGKVPEGSRWLVPADLHEPIRQDAVLLESASGNDAAKRLLEFLRSEEALRAIRGFGYETAGE